MNYEEKIKSLLETKSIPFVVGYIYSLFQEDEIDENEEIALYILADPDQRFNAPSEYHSLVCAINWDDFKRPIEEWNDFTPEMVARLEADEDIEKLIKS